jgi:hypothetical protein
VQQKTQDFYRNNGVTQRPAITEADPGKHTETRGRLGIFLLSHHQAGLPGIGGLQIPVIIYCSFHQYQILDCPSDINLTPNAEILSQPTKHAQNSILRMVNGG